MIAAIIHLGAEHAAFLQGAPIGIVREPHFTPNPSQEQCKFDNRRYGTETGQSTGGPRRCYIVQGPDRMGITA